MKFGGKGPANRAEAWACATSNFALPGAGSLAAGKSVGYWQLALAALGFVLSLVTGIQMLQWMMANWDRVVSGAGDPVNNLVTIWDEIRWPLAGLAIFAVALIWAGITSMQILAAHPKNPKPPPIVN